MKKDFIVVALLLFIASNIAFLRDLPSMDFFHRDEANWIRVSIFSFNTFFIERNYQDDGWSNSFRTFGFQNPQVGKFIIGGSLYLHNYRDFEGVIAWNPDEDLEWHVDQGVVPPAEERFAARLPVILLASGTVSLVGVLTMIVLSYLLRSRMLLFLGGIVAATFFATHPLIWNHGHQAMLDVPAIFFSTLAIFFITVTILRCPKGLSKRSLFLGFAGALSTGLAISTKMNALLTWGVILLVLLIGLIGSWVFKMQQGKRNNYFVIQLLFQLVIPPAIFFGSNPFLYNDSIANLKRMILFSGRIANRRAQLPNAALYTFFEKVNAFSKLGFGGSASSLHVNALFNLLIFAIGFAAICYALFKFRNAQAEVTLTFLLLLIWVCGVGLGVLWWTPLAWGRYYVPWVPAASIIQGIGIAYLALIISQKVFRRFVRLPE